MLKCVVTSPDETTRYDRLRSVTVPSVSGETQILPGHTEAFFALVKGNIILDISQKRTKKVMSIMEGECYVHDDEVVIVL